MYIHTQTYIHTVTWNNLLLLLSHWTNVHVAGIWSIKSECIGISSLWITWQKGAPVYSTPNNVLSPDRRVLLCTAHQTMYYHLTEGCSCVQYTKQCIITWQKGAPVYSTPNNVLSPDRRVLLCTVHQTMCYHLTEGCSCVQYTKQCFITWQKGAPVYSTPSNVLSPDRRVLLHMYSTTNNVLSPDRRVLLCTVYQTMYYQLTEGCSCV